VVDKAIDSGEKEWAYRRRRWSIFYRSRDIVCLKFDCCLIT